MSKRRASLLSAVLFCFGVMVMCAAGDTVMSVQVKQSDVRSSPSGLGSIVAAVKLGDQLTVIEERGVWTKVSTAGGTTGWIPSSSLVKGTIKINAGGKDAQVAASSDEMSLATKGFNSDVESKFKQENKNIDFTWVDRMQQFKVSLDDIRAFMKQGKLNVEKGGAQ